MQWCKKNQESLDDWWKSDQTQIHHFIGKDITYFSHVVLAGVCIRRVTHCRSSFTFTAFLTVDGEKMSKSKGTTGLRCNIPQALGSRFLAIHFTHPSSVHVSTTSILNLTEFANKVNSDLVGKVVNLASRTARFVEEVGLSKVYPHDGGLFASAAAAGEKIGQAYEQLDYARATRWIMELADQANAYCRKHGSLDVAKGSHATSPTPRGMHCRVESISTALCLSHSVLPKLSEQCGALLNAPITHWK